VEQKESNSQCEVCVSPHDWFVAKVAFGVLGIIFGLFAAIFTLISFSPTSKLVRTRNFFHQNGKA